MRKERFKELVKELKAMTTAKVVISKKKIKRPDKIGVEGAFSSKDNRINIYVFGNQSYSLILMVLAHEVRHAIHAKKGLFSDYYRKELNFKSKLNRKKFFEKVYEGKTPLPSQENAMEAETDCNKFAIYFMKSKNIKINYSLKSYSHFLKYSDINTLAFRINLEYAQWLNDKKEQEIKSPAVPQKRKC